MTALVAALGHGGALGWLCTVVVAGAGLASGVRWLRVAQREHYVAGSVSRFALRWWRSSPLNAALATSALAGAVASGFVPGAALVCAVAVTVGPVGLRWRGTSAPLVLTRRLRTLGATWVVLEVMVVAAGVALGAGPAVAALVASCTPVVVDGALALTAPLEGLVGRRFVDRAAQRLRQVAPTVVAITGSYGKTSTKGYVGHLVAGARTVVTSPASFNNRAGLARTINEQLVPGTEVFVAEMGTFGSGEIADLCRWVPPDISVITAIGPVHLERFGSEERIVAAKSEILVRAPVVVLMVDDPRLAEVADRCQAAGKVVWRCGTRRESEVGGTEPCGARAADEAVAAEAVGGTEPCGARGADEAVAAAARASATTGRGERRVVAVAGSGGMTVWAAGQLVAEDVGCSAQPSNVACAVAVALELGVPAAEIAARLAGLPVAAHRLEVTEAVSGSVVLDDTYNANPAGAAAALERLAASGGSGARRVVVTPGMVELGRRQRAENERFAAAAAAVATDVVVVGRTNRRALVAGARRGRATVHLASTRAAAVAWVRGVLGPGDVVLYENDLPDHYP